MKTMVLGIVKRLIAGVLAIFRRLLCFLNIKRNRHNSGNILPLHSDGASVLSNSVMSLPSNDHTDMELESWDSWGAEDTRQFNHVNNIGEEQEEQEVDYFQDMVPHLKKTKKILVRKKEDYTQRSEGFSKRLGITTDVPLDGDPALGAWDDTENAWGAEQQEDLSYEAEHAIKEQRRGEREQRQVEQRSRKLEKDRVRGGHKTGFTAVKLS